MNRALTIISWNVKGIRTKEKVDRLWQAMRKNKEVMCWCIQEHRLEASVPCKQALGELVFFYAYGEDGSSGACMAVNRDLHPKLLSSTPLVEHWGCKS